MRPKILSGGERQTDIWGWGKIQKRKNLGRKIPNNNSENFSGAR